MKDSEAERLSDRLRLYQNAGKVSAAEAIERLRHNSAAAGFDVAHLIEWNRCSISREIVQEPRSEMRVFRRMLECLKEVGEGLTDRLEWDPGCGLPTAGCFLWCLLLALIALSRWIGCAPAP